MKRIVFPVIPVFILMMCISSLLEAQPRRNMDPEKMAARQTEMMTKELSLSEDQVAIVDSINLAFAGQLKEVMDANKGDREGARAAIMEVRGQHNEALKAVLTEEQFTSLEAIMKERERRGPRGGGQGRGPGQ